ncbi:MAG: hypothetical protein APF76_02335 [Desulfitibacter sp. BRH_c19]|nr:MAG: hypothetical protein APF76_02335 [Desulfitibacter sp. BRH_c19]
MSSGIFFGINIGLKALRAQQTAISVTGHNIANANTPGYSRQVANMHTGFALPVPSNNRWAGAGQIGTGVEISEVKRIRDQFIDWQIRAEDGKLSEWETRHDTISQIETVFLEPSDTGLSSLMGEFWDSWQELIKYPEISPVRTTVKDTGKALAEAFRHSYERLENIEEGLDRQMEIAVDEANALLRQIGSLNEQIKFIKTGGDNPNDLMDKRDLLVDNLAELMDTEVNHVFATVAGKTIATGEITVAVKTTDTNGDPAIVNIIDPSLDSGHLEFGRDDLDVTLVDSENESHTLAAKTGEVFGIQKAGNDTNPDSTSVAYYKNKLDTFAEGMSRILNEIHASGINLKDPPDNTGIDFFAFKDEEGNIITDPDNYSAKHLYINPQIEDVGFIAAGYVDDVDDFNPGNRENALLIAQLRNARFSLDGDGKLQSNTMGDLKFETFYQNFVSEVGVATKEAERMVQNQSTLVNQLSNRKESVAGVSIDEETANMISYQRAFQAASRYIQVLDELAATVVNGLKA